MWDFFVSTQFSYYRDFFCSGIALCLRERHCHRWVRYIDTAKIAVISFVWDCLVFTQYSYYCDFFCSGLALRLRNLHRHVWVRYIDSTKVTVWCISSLLFSIDIQRLCYFIMVHFELTNGAMVQWWMVKLFNG